METRVYKTVLLSALGLGVAAGGPPLVVNGANAITNQTARWKEAWHASSTGAVDARLPVPLPPDTPQPPLEGPADATLVDFLSWDITPGWVLQNWSRVFTLSGPIHLLGYRVPLVTGTREDDLAGSLTYYFSPDQKLQRITFFGTTGSPKELVTVLTTRHGFVRQILNDPGLYQFEVPAPAGQAPSVLRFRSAQTVRSDSPYDRFQVQLVMERPEE